jgi:sirohydrochlorin cobaltochelatase
MNSVIVLAMHGAPPNDYPEDNLLEFFGLHSRIEHAPDQISPGIEHRYHELETQIRSWPRTTENDPFFAGSQVLAEKLEVETGKQVFLGFNEFCNPRMGDALNQAADSGAELVVVITPMMTRGGEHSEIDIPNTIHAAQERHPKTNFHYVWPFDPSSVASFLSNQIKFSLSTPTNS